MSSNASLHIPHICSLESVGEGEEAGNSKLGYHSLGIGFLHQTRPEFVFVLAVSHKHELRRLFFPGRVWHIVFAVPHWDAIVDDDFLPLAQAPEVEVKYA